MNLRGDNVLTTRTGFSPQPSLILCHTTLTCPVESLAAPPLSSGHWAEWASVAQRLDYVVAQSIPRGGVQIIRVNTLSHWAYFRCWSVYEEKMSE